MKITDRMDIDIQNIEGVFFAELKINGKLTHEDYMVLVPMMENTVKLVPNPKVNMLIDAQEFTGWELQAAWDDFRFGMEFKDTFVKIAIVGTKAWQEYIAKMGDWFIDGEVKFFFDLNEAKDWIKK